MSRFCHGEYAAIDTVLSQGGQWPTAYPLDTMLRIHCMQHWYNLSDGAI
jgi:IS5 family transposase